MLDNNDAPCLRTPGPLARPAHCPGPANGPAQRAARHLLAVQKASYVCLRGVSASARGQLGQSAVSACSMGDGCRVNPGGAAFRVPRCAHTLAAGSPDSPDLCVSGEAEIITYFAAGRDAIRTLGETAIGRRDSTGGRNERRSAEEERANTRSVNSPLKPCCLTRSKAPIKHVLFHLFRRARPVALLPPFRCRPTSSRRNDVGDRVMVHASIAVVEHVFLLMFARCSCMRV